MIRASIFPWRLFELIQKELVTTFATERYFLPRVGRSITTFNIQGGKNLRDETQKTSVYTVGLRGTGRMGVRDSRETQPGGDGRIYF